MVFAYVLYAGLILASGVGVLWGVGSLLVGFLSFRRSELG